MSITIAPGREELPPRRLTITEAIVYRDDKWLLQVGFDRDGRAREIFLIDRLPIDGPLQGRIAELAIRASHWLQAGVPPADLAERFAESEPEHGGLFYLALMAAKRLEEQDGALLRETHLCAEGKHPLQTRRGE